MNELALNFGQAVIKGKTIKANIGINKGKISEISQKKIHAKKELDCSGKLILSGAIDLHVHFRTPGAMQKEDWITGSMSAIAGGITTVFDMPNNNPSMDSMQNLRKKQKLIEGKSFVNYGLFLAATNSNLNELKKNKKYPLKYYLGETTGGILIDSFKAIEKGFSIAGKKKIPCFIHGESNKVIEENRKNFSGKLTAMHHSKIRSIGAELESIEFALKIWKKTKNRIHFTHVSSPQAVELIEEEKSRNSIAKKLVSFDAAPHHLFLNNSMLEKLKNFGKMNPPLRNKAQQKKMLEFLHEGIINFVFSDHAPHLKEEKEQEYEMAPSGVPGVQTLFPLLLNEAINARLSFEKLNEITSMNPAKLMGLRKKGIINKGFDADLIIVNLFKETKIQDNAMHYKCKWTPFNGMKLKGKIEATIVNGKIAFDKKEFFEPEGKFLEINK
ncbi:MAG: dihydroorotase [Candidatus Diapherotrites archaeon]